MSPADVLSIARQRLSTLRSGSSGRTGTQYEVNEGDEESQPARAPNGEVSPASDEENEESPDGWVTVLDLLAERRRRGILLRDGGLEGLLIGDPHNQLTPAFEATLRAREAELLGLLRDTARLMEPKETTV